MTFIVEQVYIFFYAILAGAIAAFLYDILRIKRRAVRTGVIFVSLEDILYWLVAAVVMFIAVYNTNSGEMRGYIFIGNVIGVILYETLFSNIIIKSSVMVINLIKRIFKFLWMVLTYPFKLLYKLISIPVLFIFRLICKPLRLLGRGFIHVIRKIDVKGRAGRLGHGTLKLKRKAGLYTRKRIVGLAKRIVKNSDDGSDGSKNYVGEDQEADRLNDHSQNSSNGESRRQKKEKRRSSNKNKKDLSKK